MHIQACQSSPSFGVKFNQANIKSMVKTDAKRLEKNLQELQNREIQFNQIIDYLGTTGKNYNPQIVRFFQTSSESKKICNALEQFKKLLPELTKYGDPETNLIISKYEEKKPHINQAFNRIARGFTFEISNPKFKNWTLPIRFEHDFQTQGNIPPEKNENLSITPFMDFFTNKTYAKNKYLSIEPENQAKDFIQILELVYLNEHRFRGRHNDANEVLKEYNIDDPHWEDLAQKLDKRRAGNLESGNDENEAFNNAIDKFTDDLGIF